MKIKKGTPVVVTTAHRGIFVGALAEDYENTDTLALDNGHMVVYHSADSHGVVGIARRGPGSGARVSPPAKIALRAVTAVFVATPEAKAKWEAEPWG